MTAVLLAAALAAQQPDFRDAGAVNDLLGPEAEAEGPWSKGWQFSLSGPIYAGTNEIQRNIAAERMLGLPRK